MLAFYFFSLVFSSILWIIYIFSYINTKLGSMPFKSLGLADMTVYLALVLLPLFVLWLIFGYCNQYLANKNNAKSLANILNQLKKCQDYSDLLARVLIESEQQIKNGFILNRFDLLVADMNEMLSEIIQGCNIASKEQIENLWSKVQNGGKWSFGKVLIEVSQNQPNFQMRLFEKAQKNLMLAGTIMEFCARYQSVIKLLEKHDQEKLYYNMLETGVMGKVFSILAPISDEIRRTKESPAPFSARKEIFSAQISAEEKVSEDVEQEPKASFVSKINPFKKKKEPIFEEDEEEPQKDPFSLALEKSFRAEEPAAPRNEPAFDSAPAGEDPEDAMPTPVISAPLREEEPEEAMLTNTQKKLNSLKKEWQEMNETKKEKPVEDEEEASLSYPFGGWTDAENYRR